MVATSMYGYGYNANYTVRREGFGGITYFSGVKFVKENIS
jgi:hypothetical protein